MTIIQNYNNNNEFEDECKNMKRNQKKEAVVERVRESQKIEEERTEGNQQGIRWRRGKAIERKKGKRHQRSTGKSNFEEKKDTHL